MQLYTSLKGEDERKENHAISVKSSLFSYGSHPCFRQEATWNNGEWMSFR